MLPYSPSKQERFERHLSRQRGAGVRDISTSFGFSFGVPSICAKTVKSLDEPLRKRRKISSDQEHTAGNATSNAPTHVESKPRKACKPAIEVVGEVACHENQTTSKTPAAISKPAKTKGKQRRVISETPIEGAVPSNQESGIGGRRPKRKAAVDAIAKVIEGFLEEDIPIDTKRRHAETAPRRRGRKTSKPTVEVCAENPPEIPGDGSREASLLGRQSHSPLPRCQASSTPHTTKDRAHNDVSKPKRGRPRKPLPHDLQNISARRLPLAETKVGNAILPTYSEGVSEPTKKASSHEVLLNDENFIHSKPGGPKLSPPKSSSINDDYQVEHVPAVRIVAPLATRGAIKSRSAANSRKRKASDPHSAAPRNESRTRLCTNQGLPRSPTDAQHGSTSAEHNSYPAQTLNTVQNLPDVDESSAAHEAAMKQIAKPHLKKCSRGTKATRKAPQVGVLDDSLYNELSNHIIHARSGINRVGQKAMEAAPGKTAAKSSTVGTFPSVTVATKRQEASKHEDIDWLFESQPRKPASAALSGRGFTHKGRAAAAMPDIDLDAMLLDIQSLARKDHKRAAVGR